MRTKQAASIAQARGPPAKQIKTMKQILDQPLNMPALRIDLNNKWSIQRERYLFESPHRESYEQQRLQHVDVLSYVLHDRCGNELHHLGKSYTHPTEICDYLWTFLGGDCLKDCKRSDIKLFLPVFPDTFFWTGVDPQEASIDLDTWINLLHRYFGRWTRLHVHLDLSFHEDECECENCMNDPKRVDSQNQTNKGKGSSSNAENWSKSPAASDRPESVGTSMERSQAKPSPQSGRKRKLGTALGIKENPGCTCGKCKTVYRSKRAMDTDTEPGEISDQGISNRPSVV